eukprot:1179672-Amphidinium_carterae.1
MRRSKNEHQMPTSRTPDAYISTPHAYIMTLRAYIRTPKTYMIKATLNPPNQQNMTSDHKLQLKHHQ